MGTAFGLPTDRIDVEVVMKISSQPDRAMGFQLRNDANRPARQGMLDLLRDAFNHNRTVSVDYNLDAGRKNGVAIRVADEVSARIERPRRHELELPEELRQALEADDAEEFHLLLRRRRPEDQEALLALLTTDPSVPPDHRTKALFGLGQWGDPTVVPAITRLLPELDDRGKIAALSALGRLPTTESTAALAEHVHDASPQVRKTAVVALSKSDAPEARATLREVAAAEPVEWLRDLAARAVSTE